MLSHKSCQLEMRLLFLFIASSSEMFIFDLSSKHFPERLFHNELAHQWFQSSKIYLFTFVHTKFRSETDVMRNVVLIAVAACSRQCLTL